MLEYRYVGLNLSGKPVQGILFVESPFSLQRTIREFAGKHKISISQVQKKSTFMYKVRKGNNPPIKGEQRAFTQAEVQNALHNMGYEIISVNKKIIELPGRVPINDIVIFIRLCADLLREKFPYDEVLQLLMNDTANKTLKDAIRDIHKDLKMGKEGTQVYTKHQKIFGKFATTMLSIASTSGNMVQMYQSTAKYLERDADFKKSMKRALLMPAVVLISIFLTFAFYLMYIFPETTGLLLKYDMPIPPMTKASMQMSEFLMANGFYLLMALILPIIGAFFYARTEKGKILFGRLTFKIPILGSLLHKSSVEIFARVINALYSGSGDNIYVLQTAAEACRNAYMENQIKKIVIPRMLRAGETLTGSLAKTGVFPVNAINRFRAGEESGTIKESARQLADYYEREVTYKMDMVVEWIQLIIALLVTVLIVVITLISSELGFISPDTMGSM